MRRDWEVRLGSVLLATMLVVSSMQPVFVFAAEGEGTGLCDHHMTHTPECGYVAAASGVDCTHVHSENCYVCVDCVHICEDDCISGCAHECTIENSCVKMELDCHHNHGDCGYSEKVAAQDCTSCPEVLIHAEGCGYVAPVTGVSCDCVLGEDGTVLHTEGCGFVKMVEEVKCNCVPAVQHGGEGCTLQEAQEGTPCTHECKVIVDSDTSCYKLLCSHAELDKHDNDCGYVASVEGKACTYNCQEDHDLAGLSDTNTPEENKGALSTTKEIAAWVWNDELEALMGGALALPGTSAENIAYFADIVSMLPMSITATIGESTETVVLDWTCNDYPEAGAYSGEYVFTATLSDGYVLADEAEALTLKVALDNADLYNDSDVNTEVQYYKGHAYQYINDWVSWSDAKAACEALGGHLVTITSAEEQAFCNSIWESQSYWLGGTDKADEGIWLWVTGEPFTYTNWLRGEPNNDYGGKEHYLMMRDDKGQWDDRRLSNDAGGVGCAYICEWDYIESGEKDCFSVFASAMPTLPAELAKVFLSFIGDYVAAQDSVVGNRFYKIMTGDVSDYDGDLMALKADILAMSYFIRAQNASKIESTFAASQDAAVATVTFAKAFAPSNGKISDADLGILSGYKSDAEKKLKNGIIDLMLETMFDNRFVGEIEVALDNIDTAMAYYNSIGNAVDTATDFLNGVMTAVYGLKYVSANQLNSAYNYFETYINRRPNYDSKDNMVFQEILSIQLDLIELNESILDPMLSLCGVPNWKNAIVHLNYWGEYLCNLERYVNATSLMSAGVEHYWDITLHVANEQGEIFIETICSTCGTKKIEQFPGHSHSWSNVWSYNDTHHWHACENLGCSIYEVSQNNGYEKHNFVNGVCVCGKAGHVHQWTYTAKGNTITALCTNTDGACSDPEQSVTLVAPEDSTYSGEANGIASITGNIAGQTVTLRYTGTDYNSEEAPINAGTYTVTMSVDGKNVSDTFTIVPKTVSNCAFALIEDTFTYSGEIPAITVTGTDSGVGNYAMELNIDYTVSSVTAVDVGSYKVTVSGKGNYGGTMELGYSIAAKPITITDATIQDVIYNADGYALNVTGVTFNGIVEGETLELGKDYTATAALTGTNAVGNSPVTVTVTLKNGNYTLSSTAFETVVAISKAEASCTAPIAKIGMIYTGIAQDLITAGTTSSGELQYSLEENGIYTEAVPVGKNAGDYIVWYYVEGDNNHSNSAKASMKVIIGQKEITPTITGSVTKAYDGNTDVPAGNTLSITLNGIAGNDDVKVTASYTYDNANAGISKINATNIILSGADAANYKLTATTASADVGTITAAVIEPDVSGIATDYIGSGEAIQPVPTVTNGDTVLTAGKDYIVTYGTNKEGTGNVVITAKGNYSFSPINVEFTIAHAQDQRILQAGLTEVPDGLNAVYSTVDALKQTMTRTLIQATNWSKDNVVHYDVKLQFKVNGDWIDATEENFPSEGITVMLPYPAGTGRYTHDFRVAHMFTVTSARLDTETGEIEIPAVTKTADGIRVTLKGLSPVSIVSTSIEYDVNVVEAKNGTVTVSQSKVTAGTQITVTVTPKNSWYKMETLLVKDITGNNVTITYAGNGKYAFTMPASDVTVTATFIAKYTSIADNTNPKTGDDFNIAMWSGIAMTSLLCVAMMVWLFSRKRGKFQR